MSSDWVLGIDGGGTHTRALLAERLPREGAERVGRGMAGPSNPMAVGFEACFTALQAAVAGAYAAAGVRPGTACAAAIALAGAGRAEEQARIAEWAARTHLADRLIFVTDAEALLAAGTADSWGLAVISGTGSLAYARDRDGRASRAGGWGYLFGDEGSSYALAVDGLRACARSIDGRGPQTRLVAEMMAAVGAQQPHELVSRIYGEWSERRKAASLAKVVSQVAAEGDETARGIMDQAASDLARCAMAACRRAFDTPRPVPVALGGGLLLGCGLLADGFLKHLADAGWPADPPTRVDEPAIGAVRLARDASGPQ
jgi:N-acetylglucosamine kinase-like BadF-type ATPase